MKVQSVFHLIAEITNRDFPDIVNLIRANKVSFKEKAFKELCLKYGTQELYDKIVKSM